MIGAVNFEHTGISGVEGYYDTLLRGSTGVITAEVDSQRNPIWIAPQEVYPASPGVDLQLTIDPTVQHIIETELKRAVDAHNADGGVVIVMDPRTGAILGMTSYPTFDPNRYFEYTPETYNLNPAVGTQYEPGSTFKIFTVAAGLQRAPSPPTRWWTIRAVSIATAGACRTGTRRQWSRQPGKGALLFEQCGRAATGGTDRRRPFLRDAG